MSAPDHRPGAAFELVKVSDVTDEIVAALQRLVPQLSPSAAVPTRQRIEEIVASEHCTLFVARMPAITPMIVGTLTVVAYPLPSGVRVWIEDVVVDQSARGRGLGEALVRAGLSHASAMGALAVNLTSNPGRVAANRLYRRLGFVRRETNTYRFFFDA